jgi:hypothetical protein
MMRNVAIAVAILLVLGIGVGVFVTQRQPAGAATGTTTIRGEVVDLACYLAHNLTGPKHAACALSCAEGGAPLGILDKKAGQVYLVVLDHDKLMGAKSNQVLAMLKPHIAKNVVAKGKILQRGGLTGILLTGVTPAK